MTIEFAAMVEALCVEMGKDVVVFPKYNHQILLAKKTITTKNIDEIFEELISATNMLVDKRDKYDDFIIERKRTRTMHSNPIYTNWINRVNAVVEEMKELNFLCTKKRNSLSCFGSMSRSSVVEKMRDARSRVCALLEEADIEVMDLLVANLFGRYARRLTITS